MNWYAKIMGRLRSIQALLPVGGAASQASVNAGFLAGAKDATVAKEATSTAIKAKTDNLPAAPANQVTSLVIENFTELNDHHIHSAQRVRPSGAAPITLTSGAGAWNLGAFSADIIPAGAEALPFDLHWVDISNPDTNADYEVVFYYGPTDIEAARVAFSRNQVQFRSFQIHLQSEMLPAGSRVRAKMMDSIGGSTCGAKVFLHLYP